ncbi:MAG: hypothetical protein O2901_10350 [Verrucomicrobia bacterium]|nr:hypothetical protein [Verrucomicrobiota bacterium]
MAKLLSEDPPLEDRAPASAPVYHIGDQICRNSAARFWFGFVDELIEDFPQCDAAHLTTLSEGPLRRDQLRPHAALERYLEEAPAQDLEAMIRQAAAELELFGPPGSVSVELKHGDESIGQYVLPDECVDTEIFPYLLVWLLEWASLEESHWNGEHVVGVVDAVEPAYHRAYHLDFSLHNQHIREGLMRRAIALNFHSCGFA